MQSSANIQPQDVTFTPLAIDYSGFTEIDDCGTLEVGANYKVTTTKTISGADNQPCLTVPHSADDDTFNVIYIPQDVTFTVNGGNSTGQNGGGGGIYMSGVSDTEYSRIMVRGQGTLNIKGGAGGKAGTGANGGNAFINYTGDYQMHGGNGGTGGYGSGGEGSAIGSNGAKGGNGGASGAKCNVYAGSPQSYCDASAGGRGNNGGSISNFVLGKVNILDSVTVNVTKGNNQTSATGTPVTGIHDNNRWTLGNIIITQLAAELAQMAAQDQGAMHLVSAELVVEELRPLLKQTTMGMTTYIHKVKPINLERINHIHAVGQG